MSLLRYPVELLQSLVGIAAAAFLYVVLVSIYRLNFHPLARLPGPFLSKISGWPLYLYARRGDRHLQDGRAHELYGPVVRIGPNAVSFNTAAALQEIYGNRKANVQKAGWYKTIDAPSGAYSTQSEPDRARHARRRRILDQAFSESALKSMETFILDNIRLWCTQLGKPNDGVQEGEKDGWSSSKSMSDWTTYLNYDIMGDLAFGKSFHTITSDEHRSVPKIAMGASAFMYPLGYHPLIAFFRPLLRSPTLLPLLLGSTAHAELHLIAYTDAQIAARIALETPSPHSPRDPPRKDFMHHLLRAVDPDTNAGFSPAELRAEASALIEAGGDTSASTLAATFFYLLRDPAVHGKLTREVREAFTDVEKIRWGPPLTELVYLRAVVDETLRISPPAPSHLPREVLPGGLVVDGEYFPAGVTVGTSAYVVHHNAEYFPEPYRFRPERWIEGDGVSAESVRIARGAFCAFSLGSRGCVGRKLVYMELMLSLAWCLWLLDVRAAGGKVSGGGGRGAKHWGRKREEEYQLVDRFVAEREGPVVEFRRRLRS